MVYWSWRSWLVACEYHGSGDVTETPAPPRVELTAAVTLTHSPPSASQATCALFSCYPECTSKSLCVSKLFVVMPSWRQHQESRTPYNPHPLPQPRHPRFVCTTTNASERRSYRSIPLSDKTNFVVQNTGIANTQRKQTVLSNAGVDRHRQNDRQPPRQEQNI